MGGAGEATKENCLYQRVPVFCQDWMASSSTSLQPRTPGYLACLYFSLKSLTSTETQLHKPKVRRR